MVLFQVIADLFGIVDLVALAGLFNSFRMMRLPERPASDTLRETTLGWRRDEAARTRGRITRCRQDRLAGLEIGVFNGRGSSSSVDA
jgi:hypothetical protein